MTMPECSWTKRCQGINCEDAGICVTSHVSDGPSGNTHNINTDYTVQIAGITIPIVKTNRDFSVSYQEQFGQPTITGYSHVYGTADLVPMECNPRPGNSPTVTVADHCKIEKSTLHYLDQRYGVCLYRYQVDEIIFNATSSEKAEFKGTWGQISVHQVQVRDNNYTATSKEEWHLIVNGVDTIIATVTKQLHPFGGKNNGKSRREMGQTDGLFLDFKPDPETRKVLLFPQPPSLGLPWSDVIYRLGFYDYGNEPMSESELNRLDGGCKDMYYPEWCRSLQQDPFWRAAADRRYMVSWWHDELQASTGYAPNHVFVDPIPVGSFAKHPLVGEIYQFLITQFNGTNKVITSPNINSIIDKQLIKHLFRTFNTTLYYPIGVI